MPVYFALDARIFVFRHQSGHGLTPIRTLVYALVGQVGMLPGTLVFVNTGTQLARVDSLQGILSPPGYGKKTTHPKKRSTGFHGIMHG